MARYEACPSSYVREWEVENFIQHNQVEGVDAGEVAAQGTRLHDILKDLPFFSEKWGMGTRYAIRRRIDTLAEERGVTLRPGDGWFLYDSTRKRNALIDSLIERAGGAAAVVEFFDAGRIRHSFDDAGHPVPVTMLPDVLVTATGPNGRHELFCDYKTGYLGVAKAGTNRQLLTGAALVDLRSKAKGISLDSVQVAFLQRADAAPGLVDAVTFQRPQLDAAVKWLGQLAIDRDRWLRAYNSRRDSEGSPDAAMHDFLEKAAQPGDHCDHCKGGICCQKMQRTVGARMNLTTENTEGLLKFAHRQVKDSIKSLEADVKKPVEQTSFDPDKLPMNIETLSSTLAWSKALTEGAALPKKVWEDAAELTRQLSARGVRPDGWGLKEGSKRFLFRDNLPLLNPDGEVATDEATRLPIELPADTRPPAIYAALRELMPEVEYADFINQACDVDPKKVQALLADAHNVDARQVYDTVLCPLGPRNPVEMRPNAPSVVAVVQVSAEQEQATAEAGRAVIEGKSKKEVPLLPGDGEGAKKNKINKK
jgi:hypothetical protein